MSDKPEKIWISNKSLEDISALMGYHNNLNAEVSAVMVPDKVEYIRADIAKPSEWISCLIHELEYAAFNLCEKTDDDIEQGVIESTCPETTLFLAIRELKRRLSPPAKTP